MAASSLHEFSEEGMRSSEEWLESFVTVGGSLVSAPAKAREPASPAPSVLPESETAVGTSVGDDDDEDSNDDQVALMAEWDQVAAATLIGDALPSRSRQRRRPARYGGGAA